MSKLNQIWNNKGFNPIFHHNRKMWIRKNWPELSEWIEKELEQQGGAD